MKHTLAIVAVLVFCGVSWSEAPDLSKLDVVERSLPDGPVATVGENAVSREDFLELYRAKLAALRLASEGAPVSDNDRVRAGLVTLTELIQREILYREAQKRGLQVTEAEVQRAVDEEVTSLREALTERGKTQEAEELTARAQQNAVQMRAEMRKSLLVQKAADAVVQNAAVDVPEAELRKAYEENKDFFKNPGAIHLKQIYIRPGAKPETATEAEWQAARDRMDKALSRIRSGERFESVAKTISESPYAEKEGDLGLLPAEKLLPAYVEAAQRLKPGEISEVITTREGLHLLQLVETQESKSLSFEEARPFLEEELKARKREEILDAHVEPIIQDPQLVRVFLQIERNLASLADRP